MALAVVVVVALVGCTTSEGAGTAPTTTQAGADRPSQYVQSDLRPWARDVLDLSDERDLATATIYADFYVKANSIEEVRRLWLAQIQDDVLTCLTKAGVAPPQGVELNDAVEAMIYMQVDTLTPPVKGRGGPSTAVINRWRTTAEARGCTGEDVLSTGYLRAGPYGRRYLEAQRGDTWKPEPAVAKEIDASVERFCPEGVTVQDGGCFRIPALLRATAPLHRKIIDANWDQLRSR